MPTEKVEALKNDLDDERGRRPDPYIKSPSLAAPDPGDEAQDARPEPGLNETLTFHGVTGRSNCSTSWSGTRLLHATKHAASARQ